jgi:hypothetical protein
VWWILNGRRHKGQEIIQVQDIDPADFIKYLKAESSKTLKAKEASKHISKEKQEQIRKKQDQIIYRRIQTRAQKNKN